MKSDFNGTLSKEKLLWFIAAAGFLLLCGPTFVFYSAAQQKMMKFRSERLTEG